MSLHITIKAGDDVYTWEVTNVTPERARNEPNQYMARRDDNDTNGGWTAAIGFEHTPTDGAGVLVSKVMQMLPPPNPDVPTPEGWVVSTVIRDASDRWCDGNRPGTYDVRGVTKRE